ncbi:MAG TPA: hypothetical protein H9803_03325 [Candidatus Ligilactobacillus excrementavium]|nr:hypothetical protein [Candidatus Ligilactobacillus excrementavium]
MNVFTPYKKVNSWLFPSGQGLISNGINSAGIDTFSDVPINSITREGIQNSLDAKDSNIKEPVEVDFSLSYISSKEIPGVNQLCNEVLPAMRKKWSDSETAMNFFETYESVITKQKVPVLRISDYNTKGLAEKNWQSLIFVAGDSVKDDEASAGSKGIGKFAPFAASNLRMVFYHTISANEGERSIGVSQLVSYDKKDNEITQGPGYFSPELKNGCYQPMNEDLPFTIDRRIDQLGTDLLVVGFKSDMEWKNLIKMSVLSNFLISIWNEELIVKVEDEIIDKKSLNGLFTYFEKLDTDNKGKRNAFKVSDEFKDSLRAFKVLNNSDVKHYRLPDEMVNKYEFIDSAEDGHLYLALLDDSNRKVLQTRKSGMKINYKNGISGSINFFGIFQATGQKLNKFLKDIENANHDDWYVDRIFDKKKKANAKNFLKELRKFYKESVNEAFAVKNSEVMDIFGLNNLLTVQGNHTENNEEKSLNLEKKISELTIKKNESKKKVSNSKKRESKIIGTIFGGNDSEEKKRRGHERRETNGGKSSEPETSRNTIKRGAELTDIQVRIIEIDPKDGKYRVNIRSPKKRERIEIELQVTGENGVDEKVDINSFEIENAERFSDSSLLLKDVQKNRMITGTIKVNFDSRVRLGGKIYEVKK